MLNQLHSSHLNPRIMNQDIITANSNKILISHGTRGLRYGQCGPGGLLQGPYPLPKIVLFQARGRERE